jgi:nitroimidazol reductase NimA-like FMN-containing flavoprotein (pyridoxamine 5'-phosphate oxidase superfamily)
VRRIDKEITDRAAIEAIIAKAEICHLGLCDNGIPYIVPVNFGYKDNCLYFHCAREGTKLDIIRRNSNVCVEFDTELEMRIDDVACEWGFKYKSVIAFGKADIIDGSDEKRQALDIIMGHYSDKSYSYLDKRIDGIYIVRIAIEKMTGKQAG